MIGRIIRHPKAVIFFVLAVTLFLGMQIPKILINNEVDIFLPEDNSSKIGYNEMKATFGSQTIMDVAVKTKNGAILTAENITLIKRLTEKFEELDNIDDVTSLTNADFIEGTSEGMAVKPLAEDFSGTEEEVRELKRKLFSWKEMYELNLISEDLKSTQILVKLKVDTTAEDEEVIYHEIKKILNENRNDSVDYFLAGDPVVIVLIEEYMKSDLARLIPFVIVVVLITLFMCFRTTGGVLLPIITVITSTIWTVGLMALFGFYFSLVSTTLPVLLIAIGSAYGIHLINDYYAELKAEREELSQEEHSRIIYESIHKVGKPIVMAGITTVAGFASLATSPIIPLKHFALFSSIGVIAALVITITLIPSLLLIRKHALKSTSENKESVLDNLFSYLAVAVESKKILIFIMSIAVLLVSAAGITKVVVDHILITNFKKTEDIRVSDRIIRENFGGTKIFNVVIDGREKGALTDPEILKAMDNLDSYLENNFEEVGKVISFSDFLKRMNKVMNYPAINNPEPGEESLASDNLSGMSFMDSDGSGISSFLDGGAGSSFFTEESGTSQGNRVVSSFIEDNTGTDNVNTAVSAEDYTALLNEKMTANDFLALLSEKLASTDTTNPDADSVIKELFKDYNYKGEKYNEIPYDPSNYPAETREELKNLVSQYLLLYSGNLDSYSDDAIEPSKAIMVVQMKTINTVPVRKISRIIKDYAAENFPEGYDVSIAGYADMENAMTTLITGSQVSSLILSLLLVFIIVSFFFRSVSAGLFGVIPLSFAIVINFGVMGFARIRLDMVTAMIASIAVGIGIDYTIHFLSAYRHERLLSDNIKTVTENTMQTAGKAILFNAAAVAAGFLVLCFSNFTTLRYIGLLVALTMLTSSIAALTVLPVLLNIFKPAFIEKQELKAK